MNGAVESRAFVVNKKNVSLHLVKNKRYGKQSA
jgi:hypothetical protein